MKRKPSKLEFSDIGYYPDGSWSGICLEKEILYVYNSKFMPLPPPREDWITAPNPTEEMWDDFYKLLCDIKLKEWEKEYFDKSILDGGGWEFRIRFKDIHRTTVGINAYPNKLILDDRLIDPWEHLYEGLNNLTSGYYANQFK